MHLTAQLAGSNDCAPGTMAGMRYITRHEPPILRTVYSGADLPHLSPGQVFSEMLFASLGPPSDLTCIIEGLTELCQSDPPQAGYLL